MREPGWRWSTPHNYYYQQRAVPRIRQKETPPVLPPPHPGASILHEKPLRPLCRKEFPRTAHPKPAAPWLLPGVQRVERQALGMWPEAEGDGSGACPQGVTLVLGGAVQMIRWRHRGALWAFGGGQNGGMEPLFAPPWNLPTVPAPRLLGAGTPLTQVSTGLFQPRRCHDGRNRWRDG